MEPDAYSNQPESQKSLKERIKALFLHQNKTLPNSELDKLIEEVSLYQKELEKKSQKLAERVKELNCLYNLSLLIEKPGITPEELMNSLVELVPDSWQYPEITCARIIYDGKAFKTINFQETPWKQSAPISVNNKIKGALEIFLLQEKPEMDEGPFLKEERDLIDALTKNLGRYLEQKTMEKALRDSEENMRITLQTLGDAVIATDTDGQITRMNPVAEKLTGWKYSEAENIPIDRVFRIVNAITGKKAENPVTKVLQNGQIVGLANHTKLISKNGNEFQIADSAAPIKNEDGEVIGVVLVFRDVTQEYRMQEKLKASEELYRSVFENTGTATTILEKDGTISLANKEFAKLSGYSVEEIENKKTWMEFVLPEDLERMKEQHELRRKNSESALNEYKFRFIDKDKNLKHIHLYIDMIPGTDKSVSSLLDITVREKAEKDLNKYTTRLETAEQTAELGSWEYNLKTGEFWWSNQMFRMLNFDISDNVPDFKVYLNLIHPNDRSMIQEQIEKIENGLIPDEIIYRSNPEFGKIRFFSPTYNILKDSKGNIEKYTGTLLDITELKQKEQKLEHSHELMRYIIEHANSAVAVHDRDLNYVFVSQQYLDQYNLVEKDIIGKHHYAIFPDLPQKWRDVHQKALRGEVSKAERDPYYRDDGSTVWTRWECRPWYEADGKIGGIAIYTEVITERIEAENALRESERRLSTLMDNLPGMAYRCKNDAKWTMEFVSSGCLPLTGYRAGELQNNAVISYVQLIHPDDRKNVWEEVQAAVKEKGTFVVEYRITGKNGKVRWAWEQGRAIDIDDDGQEHIEGFIIDTTQRKLAETELKQRMEELEKFNRVMVGRENRMIELKREINELLVKLGQSKKYRIQDENEEK